jgi:ElaB/YqjD/DUF883 family membrane-anchored ribosome-binding protein
MEHSITNSSEPGKEGSIVGRVRERAAAQLSTQKDRATDGLGTVAQAVRQSAQQLRENRHDAIAQYVEKAGDQIDRLSTQLRNRDVGELVNEVQRFARKQPALFVGSAFAIGVIGARFLKSSSNDHRRRVATYGASSKGMDYAGRRM